MTTTTPERAAFAKLLTALEPYLDDLVFAGGWAHRLLALHDLANKIDFEPLATDDADIAAPLRLPIRGESSLAQRLKESGFTEELKGEDLPPITEYRLGKEDGGLYVEFIAPLVGGSTNRDGSSKDTTAVAGATAQTLRHVDLLFKEPWTVRLTAGAGFPVGENATAVRVPNAASFIAQKLLVVGRRHQSKQAKAARAKRFGQIDDLIRQAAQIAAASGRPSAPSPEQLAATCRAGLRAVFGTA